MPLGRKLLQRNSLRKRRRRSLIRKSLASLRRVRRLLLKPSLRMPRNLSRLSSSRRSRLVSHKPRRRPSSPNCLLNTRKILAKSLLPFLKMKLRVRRPRKPVLSIKLELRSKPSSNHQSQLSQIPFPTQCQSQILLHSRLTSLRSRRKRKRRRLKSRPERLPSRPSHQTQLSPLLRPLRRSTRNSRRLNSPPRRLLRRPLRKLPARAKAVAVAKAERAATIKGNDELWVANMPPEVLNSFVQTKVNEIRHQLAEVESREDSDSDSSDSDSDDE